MIAYLKSVLESIKINTLVKVWSDKKLILNSTLEKVNTSYKNDLYMPNFFVRVALFIFAAIIIGASLGFITLITLGGSYESSEGAVGARLIIYAILVLGALEFFINGKKLYRAGSDDAMLYSGLSLLLSGIFMVTANFEEENLSIIRFLIISLPILIFASIRYADMLIAATAFTALYALVYMLLDLAGKSLLAFVPFAGMILSLSIYYFIKGLKVHTHLAWWDNLLIIETLSLFCFYLSGNYFVVRELSVELMDIEIAEGGEIPFAMVFYVFTVLIPLAYLYKSFIAKDRIMMRCGLIIVALSVLTFKYYYSLGHHEITLTLAGAVMISLAWFFMKFLKSPKYGFSSEPDDSLLNTNIEALVIVESFTHKSSTENPIEFGGGSSGGGGAGGDY